MNLIFVEPSKLKPNPWNTNHLTPEEEMKLENSLTRFDGFFKPIIVRTLSSGDLEILGGEHRNAAAARLKIKEVPIINLGTIDDKRAKEISLLDNGRYGHDDAGELSKLLSELGDPNDLASFLHIDLGDMEALAAAAKINLDELDLDQEDAPEITPTPRAPKTHATMRFKVPVEDHSLVERTIKRIIADQSLNDSDSLVNAGDAFVWLVSRWMKLETERLENTP